VLKDILNKYDIRLKKDLGQHFITDKNILNKIVAAADISRDDLVLEIGTGVGTLTKALAQIAGFVISVEVDDKLIAAAKETLSGLNNVELICRDIMKLNIAKAVSGHKGFKKIKVVANLPYYITSPVISMLIEGKTKFDSMIFTIQKEVGRRIVSPPGGKEYGSFTVFINYYAKPEIVFNIPASSFTPPPKVDSSVIKLGMLDRPNVLVKDEKLFFRIVRASFNQRRKMLKNALEAARIEWPENCGIDGKRRGETLSIEEFARLSDLVFSGKK
jgi:16S rRNA (adenine1518-N6/adenine1519-N6)-dimethyltransferase